MERAEGSKVRPTGPASISFCVALEELVVIPSGCLLQNILVFSVAARSMFLVPCSVYLRPHPIRLRIRSLGRLLLLGRCWRWRVRHDDVLKVILSHGFECECENTNSEAKDTRSRNQVFEQVWTTGAVQGRSGSVVGVVV